MGCPAPHLHRSGLVTLTWQEAPPQAAAAHTAKFRVGHASASQACGSLTSCTLVQASIQHYHRSGGSSSWVNPAQRIQVRTVWCRYSGLAAISCPSTPVGRSSRGQSSFNALYAGTCPHTQGVGQTEGTHCVYNIRLRVQQHAQASRLHPLVMSAQPAGNHLWSAGRCHHLDHSLQTDLERMLSTVWPKVFSAWLAGSDTVCISEEMSLLYLSALPNDNGGSA